MTEWPLEVADQDLATGASAQDSARETLPHGHEADVHAHDDRVIAIVVGMFQHMRRLAKGHKTRVALDIENEGIQLLPRAAHVAARGWCRASTDPERQAGAACHCARN